MTIMKKIGMVLTASLVTCVLNGSVSRVHADNYCGNNIHCNTYRCYVDWNQNGISDITYHGFWNGALASNV